MQMCSADRQGPTHADALMAGNGAVEGVFARRGAERDGLLTVHRHSQVDSESINSERVPEQVMVAHSHGHLSTLSFDSIRRKGRLRRLERNSAGRTARADRVGNDPRTNHYDERPGR